MKHPSIEHYLPNNKIVLPEDKKIVLVGGCFDILHYGHIQFLQKAKDCADYLIVALEPDERIVSDKHRNPIHTQTERALNLLALHSVDKVILLPLLQGFDDYNSLVKAIRPHIIAITDNDPQSNNKAKQAMLVGAQCITVIDRIEPFSSSTIINTSKK